MTRRTLLTTTLLVFLTASPWAASAQTLEDLSPSELSTHVALAEPLGSALSREE